MDITGRILGPCEVKVLKVMQTGSSCTCFKTHALGVGSNGLPWCPPCPVLSMDLNEQQAKVLECWHSIVLV